MKTRSMISSVDVTPSASRLSESLRDIGYDFVAAIADIVDNSVSAGASKVEVVIEFEGSDSKVIVADNGSGMTEAQLNEALRFGSRREYTVDDLGRYGLGLKTASISQCRRVTVASRHSISNRRVSIKTLDMDHIDSTDRWEIFDPEDEEVVCWARRWLDNGPGTVVFWEHLDRVLPDRPETGWARRRLLNLAERSAEYLGMVFHRFIEGDGVPRLKIKVNGNYIKPWNPFAPQEQERQVLPEKRFELAVGSSHGYVRLRSFVLPSRTLFSSQTEWDRMSGPRKWNRQQGLYIYRSNRLIQGGGWCGIRAVDEHMKLGRAALDFDTNLDGVFQTNVAKMRVLLPVEIRTQLEKPISELCRVAETVYRRDVGPHGESQQTPRIGKRPFARSEEIGVAVMTAALESGQYESLQVIMEQIQISSPEIADALGWSESMPVANSA